MAQPTIYSPAFNFNDYQATHPTDPLPGGSVDNELFQVATSIAQICNNLKIIQRDDGALANNSVGAAQLQAALSIGLNQVAPWVTAHAYIANNFVYGPDNDVYQALISHTSGVFATDLANGKWTKILSFATATAAATASAASATASAASATASAASATAAATAAQALQGTSTTSVTLGTSSKSFTTQAGKQFQVGGYINITSAANPTVNNMYGVVTSYSGTALVVNVTVKNGTGTFADWIIDVSGARGAPGATGAPGPGTGDMLGANNLSDVADVSVSRANLGLGAAALQANSFFAQTASNLSDVANAATSLANLGGMAKSANLSDVANAATSLANLFGSTPVIPSGATGTTQATNDNSTKLATTAYVKAQPQVVAGTGAVGSYAMLICPAVSAGSTVAGGSCAYAQILTSNGQALYIASTGSVPSGTWQAMCAGNVGSGGTLVMALFQRIA